ncbi:marvel domain-containing protein [Annulohypoxylon truncatum]|uniref:marvel domain-containing protein n=1 Tax=Annulohypoxylon truncatum TaxID=327061 RepID=UPI0020077825|nr:marvel domain-containing protein [Annulohypoxylon truncatum]KAI1207372.1 marvel domain-containing protein [Annulohypoxylon truncatum]
METMIKSIFRILQFLLVLLTTALIGNVIASNISGSESAVNFTMFVCALSWLAVLYGIISHFVPTVSIPVAALGLDSAATLFTFIAAVVLSAKLQAVNCSHLTNKASDYIAFGSNNDEKRCREIQASTVFLWFLFASFAASLFFVLKELRRVGGSVRGPNMSQIGV